MWTKSAVREHLVQHLDPGRVRRRLQHQPFALLERHRFEKVQEAPFPARQDPRRHAGRIEILLVLRRPIRKRDRKVRRRQAEHAHRELVLLRPIEADLHPIHGPMLRDQELEPARENRFGEQEVIRIETLVGRREAEARILHQELVEQRGAGSPVADDEDRRPRQRRPGDGPAETNRLHETQEAVRQADEGVDDDDVPEGGMDREPIPPEKPKPGPERAPLPHAGRPLGLVGRGRGIVGHGCGLTEADPNLLILRDVARPARADRASSGPLSTRLCGRRGLG